MDILHRRGRATVAEVLSELTGEPAYSTVRAQLRVLEEKGHVRHEEEQLRYVYLPAQSHGWPVDRRSSMCSTRFSRGRRSRSSKRCSARMVRASHAKSSIALPIWSSAPRAKAGVDDQGDDHPARRARGHSAAEAAFGRRTACAVDRGSGDRGTAAAADVAAAVMGTRVGTARRRDRGRCSSLESAGDNAGDIVVRATGVEPGDWTIGSVLPWFWIAGSVLLCAAFSRQALRLQRLSCLGGTAPARHRAIASRVADSLSLPGAVSDLQRSRPHSAGLGHTACAHPASRRLARLA